MLIIIQYFFQGGLFDTDANNFNCLFQLIKRREGGCYPDVFIIRVFFVGISSTGRSKGYSGFFSKFYDTAGTTIHYIKADKITTPGITPAGQLFMRQLILEYF